MNFENMVEKGEIAHHEQFLLSLQCFHLYSIYMNIYIHTVTQQDSLNPFPTYRRFLTVKLAQKMLSNYFLGN